MRPIFIVVILLSSFAVVTGQERVAFSEGEKKAFVQVFWELKSFRQKQLKKLEEQARATGLTQEKRKSLQKRRASGSLTARDSLVIQELGQIEIQFGSTLERMKMQLCDAAGIPVDLYNEMLFRYRTDIDFQHTLKPVFDDYFKRQKQ